MDHNGQFNDPRCHRNGNSDTRASWKGLPQGCHPNNGRRYPWWVHFEVGYPALFTEIFQYDLVLVTILTIYLIRRNRRKVTTGAKALEDPNQNSIITEYKPKSAFYTFFNRNPQAKADILVSRGGNDLTDQKQDNEQEGPAWRKTKRNIEKNSGEGCVICLEALACLPHCFCH
ncbi:hypothetical protein CPB86DRAFT_93970 [Serendipita vermifera]|nr:hypothetical protein CPB86DRAFT_93970 [Serendipita vermifera]